MTIIQLGDKEMTKRSEKIDKIDFVLKEDKNEKLIFRFLPQQSSCHSFGDEPPTSWENVYKVYYAYEIFEQWRWDEDKEWGEPEKLFEQPCDECSIIDEIAFVCSKLAEGIEIYEREDGKKFPLLNETFQVFGMGTDWLISKHVCEACVGKEEVDNPDDYDDWDEFDCRDEKHVYYTFMMFDYGGKGFRFTLEEKQMQPFADYLKECCEYMLAHGDPI